MPTNHKRQNKQINGEPKHKQKNRIRNYCTEIFYIYEKEKYNTMFKEHLTEKAKTLTEKQLYTEMMKEWKKIDKEIYEKHIKPYKE